MQTVRAAARTVFLEFHAPRVIAAILLGNIVPFFALRAGKNNNRADIFLFGCHTFLPAAYSGRFSFTT
jgi:hypothetical protein